MIQVQIPAVMWCEEEGCKSSQPVLLYLNAAGGFAFKPSSETWQLMMHSSGSGPVVCRCPLHKTPESLITPVTIGSGPRREH